MLKKKYLFILAYLNLLIFQNFGFSQPNSNWHFGNGAALQFTTSGPTIVSSSSISTSEGCSTMSDDNGNLLFYTDGVTVWDKNNNVMFNGTGLKGGSSSSQSSIVVPAPGSFNKYYIFTSIPVESNTFLKREYCYNLIDMGLRGGLGEVVQKNIVFDTACSERLTAANQVNGFDFWIITNSLNSNTFKAFSLTSNGLSSTPVVSNVGEVVAGGIGMCKVSSDGNWLVQTFTKTNVASAQLFTFNPFNGSISNPISLNTPFNCTYGCAFSPNSKRLYLGKGFNCTSNTNVLLVQYSLSNANSSNIIASQADVNTGTSLTLGGDLSVGLDNKLYFARSGQRLSRFENPNDTAVNLVFTDAAVVFISPIRVNLGLPNYYNTINLPPSTIKVDRLSCLSYKFSFPGANNFQFKGIYTWNFGDGSSASSDSTPTKIFVRSTKDSFLVTLNFRSPDNLVSINQQVKIFLPVKPIASFTFSGNGCTNDTVKFINSSSSVNGLISRFNWNFGDGTVSSIFQPIKKYVDTGKFLIKLVVVDTLGCISDTNAALVTINKKVAANFKLQGAYCAGIPLQLIDSSKSINTTINNWNYHWNNGNSFSSFTNGNFRPTFSTEGLYNIQLVVNSVEGCRSDTVTKQYFIYNRPTANFILPKNCVLDVSNFINTSSLTSNSNIISYKWDFGVNNLFSDTSVLQNPSYQYNATNTYPVTLIVKSNQGCLDSITQNFTVNGAIPTAKLAFAINPVCSGDSVVLQNQSNVNFGSITKMEITWGTTLIIDNSPTGKNNYAFKFLEFGNPATKTEPIKLKAFSGINCFSEKDTIVTLKAQPRVRFLLPIDSLCGNNPPITLNQGLEINGTVGTFAYEGNGVVKVGATYQFLPINTNLNSKSIITYKFITPGGCFDTATQAVQIVDYPIVNAGLNKIVESGEKVLLQASAIGANLRYLWTPSALANNPTSLQPIVSTDKDTVFLLTATNTFGCFDTSSVKVRVLPPVIPPNAFSPNGDGINDTWQIKSLSDYPRSEIFIFNRYGQQVYTSIGYKNPWDGKYNQHPVPVSTYYYVINLKNGKLPIVGWVQLLR